MLLTAHPPTLYGTSPSVQTASLSATSVTQAGGGENTGILLTPSSQQHAFACGIGDVTCYTCFDEGLSTGEGFEHREGSEQAGIGKDLPKFRKEHHD